MGQNDPYGTCSINSDGKTNSTTGFGSIFVWQTGGLLVLYLVTIMKLNILLFWLTGIFDKFILFSSSGYDNVYSS